MNESLSQSLLRKIASVRGKHNAVALTTGLTQALLVALAWFPATMLLDWLIGFPWWFRALSLVAMVATCLWYITRCAILPFINPPDDETIALMVERERPEFSTRLIASVQLSRADVAVEGGSNSLVQAMIQQTDQLAGPLDFRDVIKLDRTIKLLMIACAAVLVSALVFWWGGSVSQALFQRAILMNTPLPTKTQVEVLTGNMNVPIGDAAKISARASGYKPSQGELAITYASGRTQRVPMTREADGVTYSVTLDAVQENFAYSVRIFDGRSPDFRVQALPRPVVTNLECTQIFPAYTGLAPVEKATNDLQLVAGSRLGVRVTSSKPVRLRPGADGQGNYLMRFADEKTGKSEAIPLITNPKNPRELTADMPLPPGTIAFSVNLIDDDGITSKDPAVYRIDLVPDAPPRIRITNPDRKEVLITSRSTLDVGFIAEDDYGVGSAILRYRVDEGTVQSIPLVVPPRFRAVKGYYPWEIAKVAPPSEKSSLEGSVIEFWIDVEDNNTVSGPGKVSSEKYMARVVTKAEKQAELMARLGESLGTIRDVSENQERASSELGTLLMEQRK